MVSDLLGGKEMILEDRYFKVIGNIYEDKDLLED